MNIPCEDRAALAGLEVIEFFGMPGAGKTTVAELLRDRLKEHGIDAISTQMVMADALPAWKRNLIRLWLILREGRAVMLHVADFVRIAAIPQTTQRDRLKAVYNYATVRSLIACARRTSKLLILDQGLVQAIWTAMLRAHNPQGLPDWFDEVLLNDARWHVVILDADRATLRKRLAGRASKHSRLQQKNADIAWQRGELLFSHCYARLRGLADGERVSLETVSVVDATPGEVAAKLAKGLIAC